MKVYKILAIIVIILGTMSFITYKLCKNDFNAYIGKIQEERTNGVIEKFVIRLEREKEG